MQVEGNKIEASLEIRFSFMFWLRREKNDHEKTFAP